MNCTNCGGPIADVAYSGVLLCSYCGSHQPRTGGEGLDGVLLLGSPCDMDCPACGDQLVTAVVDDMPCRACSSCYGVAIPQDDFGDLIALRRASYQGAESQNEPIDPRLLALFRECPGCRETMDVHPYYGPGNTVIDSCSTCRLVWLDVGELTSIEQAPGRR